MFKVRLVDIGHDGRFCEYDSPLETLTELEHLITGDICCILDRDDIVLVYDDELVYKVYAGGRSAGVVAIKSI